MLLPLVAMLPLTACFSTTPAPKGSELCSIPGIGVIHLLPSEIPVLSPESKAQIADNNAAYKSNCPVAK